MTDRRRHRNELERTWHELVEGAVASPRGAVRDEVRSSWARSAHCLDPRIDRAPIADDAPARWRTSRMARAFRTVEAELDRAAVDGDLVAAVTDAEGAIVWTGGGPSMRRRAEKVAFVPGGRWDEASVGTNALALALRSGRPATVWSAEHFAPIVHDWVCYSAPIIDPADGATLGVLDLSTTWNRSTPLAGSTVTALARLMSLALEPGTDDHPDGDVVLNLLGRCEVRVGGQALALPPRQLEILALLAMAPDGLTLERLHDRLHGDAPVSPATTKAELSHLRRTVGVRIGSRPYQFVSPVRADLTEVVERIERGDLDGALEVYRGPLMPSSQAPAIEDHRAVVDVALRAAVLADGDPDRLLRLSEVMVDDVYVHERARDALAPSDPRRALVEGRLSRL